MKPHWNHRVVRREYPSAGQTEALYEIHEVYYDKDGKVEMMTETGIDPVGETLEDLRLTLERMVECLDKPVLDYKTHAEIPSAT